MPNKIENNTLIEETDAQQSNYEYNFFNTPWDDRTQRSKTCIIGLLCAIFVVTMAIVINNLVIFYKGFQTHSLIHDREIHCNVMRVDKYKYAARIHSIKSQELICVGAMVGASSVLANAVCLKSGPIRIYLGSLTSHRCKKGFGVNVIEPIPHDGVVTKKLVLLTTHDKMVYCGSLVRLGSSSFKRLAFIIGRPFRGGRTLSFQSATLARFDNMTSYNKGQSLERLINQNFICVKHLSKCEVRAGDLLIQRGRLIGIASTTPQKGSELACFANLSIIHDDLRELNIDVDFDTV
ncbi:uncharacterized protein [Epargyreus clarus]|uniref:uncharacterized protein n=1 Tax=Epargyreus clarus TaxID=520877 RepID=UPI003C2D6605